MILKLCAAAMIAALAIVPSIARAEKAPLRVYAAASLADAIEAALAAYAKEKGRRAIGVYAASGVLARQIDAGAPADLFIAAHPEWTDWLAKRGMLAGSATIFARNRLVIASARGRDAARGPEVLLKAERIAVADLRAAPAGRYAAQALRKLGLYERLSARLVEAADARAAAAWTARGEVDFGLLYATDATMAKLAIVAELPAASHEPIVYILATTTDARPGAAELRAFLLGAGVATILAKRDFSPK